MSDYIPYGKQFIDERDIEAVVRVLKSDFITQGPTIEEFERRLAEYCGARFAVVFSSGTSALHSAYFAVGIREGDEFITTPITFVATSNAGLFLGAKPIFVDIEYETGNIDIYEIEKNITERTKLITVVHYAGHPVDMEKVKSIAERYNLKIIEDACHALGACYKNSKIGSCVYSDLVVFSFHPVKHITTGEGGAVLTNDEKIYEKLKMFRNHGITKDSEKFLYEFQGQWYYEMHLLGYNYRMTDFQSALGLSQLKKLDKFVNRRREIANIYNNAFMENPCFDLPIEREYAYHSYHLYTIRFRNPAIKKKVFNYLRKNGIGVQVHYIPVYKHPFYRKIGYASTCLEKAEKFYESVLSLPLYPSLTELQIERVIKTVEEACFNDI